MQYLIENLRDRRSQGWGDCAFVTEGPKQINRLHEQYAHKQQSREEENKHYSKDEGGEYHREISRQIVPQCISNQIIIELNITKYVYFLKNQ